MKTALFSGLLIAILVCPLFAMGQTTTYYSQNSGNWSDASTWDTNSGGGGASGVPSDSDNAIIQSGHTVSMTANAACKMILLYGNLSCSTYTFSITDSIWRSTGKIDATLGTISADGVRMFPNGSFAYVSTTNTIKNLIVNSSLILGSSSAVQSFTITNSLAINSGNLSFGFPRDTLYLRIQSNPSKGITGFLDASKSGSVVYIGDIVFGTTTFPSDFFLGKINHIRVQTGSLSKDVSFNGTIDVDTIYSLSGDVIFYGDVRICKMFAHGNNGQRIQCISNLTIGDGTNLGAFPFAAQGIYNSSIDNLKVNLNSATITTSQVSLKVTNLELESGTIIPGNNLSLTISGTLSRSNGKIGNTNIGSKIIFTNTSPLTLPSGLFNGNLTNMTLYGNGGVTLSENVTTAGLTLSVGTLNLGTSTLTYSGSSITRTSGDIDASSGTINFTNTSALSLPTSLFKGNIKNITLNGGGGLSLNSTTSLTGTLTLNSGTLTTGGYLTMVSNEIGTARVAQITGGAISGNVILQNYIPGGRRAFRFLGHPFTSAISISQLKDSIFITGSGGTLNNFDPTTSNNPSAFHYDPNTGNSSQAIDPGWTAFTSASSNALDWLKGRGLSIFIRGDRTQSSSITGGNPTPNAVTLRLYGTLNDGNTPSISLTQGSTSNYNLISNPLASNIDISGTTRSNVGSTIYVWDKSMGTKGAYSSASISSSYVIPSGAAFFVSCTSPNGSISFPESCKTASAAGNTLFKRAEPSALFKVWSNFGIDSAKIHWDNLELSFNESASNDLDGFDGIKFINPEVNLYTMVNSSKLSIDKRMSGNQIYNLGWATSESGNFTLEFSKLASLEGFEFYFWDGQNRKKIYPGSTIDFYSDALKTADENRFKFEVVKLSNGIESQESLGKLLLYPNPSNNQISLANPLNHIPCVGKLTIIDMLGNIVYSGEIPFGKSSQFVNLDISIFSNGTYLAIFKTVEGIYKSKFVKY
jgi:hypothetical protein